MSPGRWGARWVRDGLRVAVAAIAGHTARIDSAHRDRRFWAVRPVALSLHREEARGAPLAREVSPTEACFPPPGRKTPAWVLIPSLGLGPGPRFGIRSRAAEVHPEGPRRGI